MVSTTVRTFLGLALVGVLMTGCSGPDAASKISTFSSPGEASDSAAMAVTLVEDNGCLYAQSVEHAERWIPVLKAEFDPNWDGRTLTFKGEKYSAGTVLVLGGGESGQSEEQESIPEACDASPRWLTWSIQKDDQPR